MWDQRYSNEDYFYGTEPCDFLVRNAAFLESGRKALSIADGEGRNSVFMAEKGLQVTAMDSSAVALKKAKQLAEARNVHIDFLLADLRSWKWEPDHYDFVAAIFIQFADPEFRVAIFDGIEQTLKPGGVMLLHGYTTRQIEYRTGGPPIAEQLYTHDMLANRFSDWNILRLAEYDAEIQEGVGHSGLSALVDLVARSPG